MTREKAKKILSEYKHYCNGDKVLIPSEFSIHDRWVVDINEALGIAIACIQHELDVERKKVKRNDRGKAKQNLVESSGDSHKLLGHRQIRTS